MMNGLLADSRFLIGMGLLGSNQPSFTPQNPMQNIMQNMMAGQQMKRQLTADQRANEMHDLEKQQVIASLSAQPKREVFDGADGYKYYADGSRVLPNVVKPEEKPNLPTGMYLDPVTKLPKYHESYLEGQKTLKKAGASNNTLISKQEAEASKPLSSSERKAYRMADGSPLPVGATMNDLKSLGEQVIPVNQEQIDLQKGFDEKWAEDVKTYDSMTKSINSYKEILNKTGTKIVPDADKLKLQAEYTNMLMGAKDLFELGVLTGPDMDLLQTVAEDPTSILGNYVGKDALIEQLAAIESKVNNSKKIAARAYRQEIKEDSLNIDDLLKKYGG